MRSICIDFTMNGVPLGIDVEVSNGDDLWITYALVPTLLAFLKKIPCEDDLQDWLPKQLLVDMIRKLINIDDN